MERRQEDTGRVDTFRSVDFSTYSWAGIEITGEKGNWELGVPRSIVVPSD